MSDTFEPDDFQADQAGNLQPKMASLPRAEVRRFEKDRKALHEAQEQLAQLQRERAFFLAGIPVDDPAARYFVKGYDGDLTSEAIKQAAIEARILANTAATPEEIAAHQSMQNAAAGGTPTAPGPDYAAQLAEMGKKRFAQSDDAGQQQHINDILALAKQAGARIPIS